MKYIDENSLDELPGEILKEGDRFSFRCHPEIVCFNRCCRNLNLFLYPYDVIRLKKFLGISSNTFLDKYVDIVSRPQNFFPEVLLRMSENAEKTCPFLLESGCSVYPDRPDSCRTFPVEQGILYDAHTRKDTPFYLFRPPDFCQGQNEKEAWTVQDWISDQDAKVYSRMTIRWAELKRLFQNDPWGPEGPEGPRAKMAFMAAYNIDRFRDFVFESSFLQRYKIKTTVLKKIKADETELLKLGFAWIKLFLWGIKSKQIRLR